MNVPSEFEQVAVGFLPNYGEPWLTGRDMVNAAVIGQTRSTRLACKQFLDQILNDGTSDAELNRIWNSTSPIYWFAEKSIRSFLTVLCDAL